MKKMNFEQMEVINGGLNWCFIGKGITGIGAGILLAGGTFTCGISAAAYIAIAATTTMYC
jgi:hypothetical protein